MSFIESFENRMRAVSLAHRGNDGAGRPGELNTYENVLCDFLLHIATREGGSMLDAAGTLTTALENATVLAEYEWSMVGEQLLAKRNAAVAS